MRREKWKEERMIRVARFRLGYEMREGEYWMKKRGDVGYVDSRRKRGSMW